MLKRSGSTIFWAKNLEINKKIKIIKIYENIPYYGD